MRAKLKLTLFLIFLSSILIAQEKFSDQIIKRDGETISCKVREGGDDEIKYIVDGFRSDVVFGIDKNKVASVVFSDGNELKFSDSMAGKENYDLQRRNALKVNFFSPLTGATAYSYERSLQPGRSIEAGIGIIIKTLP